MGIGGRERHRIGAHKTAVGNVGIGAVGAHPHRTMGRSAMGAGGQSGAVGHGQGSGHHLMTGHIAAACAIGQGVADHHLGRDDGLLTARTVGGGEGDGVGAHEPLGRRIGIGAVAAHVNGAMARRAAGAGGQSRRIGRRKGSAIAGGQRSAGIAGAGGQRIGHHNMGGGRSHHAMAVGGGKGYRIGAHIAAIGHIGISAARPQTDHAMGRAGMGAGGQPGTVADRNGARGHVLGRDAAAAGAVGQNIGYGHMGRHHILLTAHPIGGGEGDGIGAHKTLRRRIGIGAVPAHTDRAMACAGRSAGGQARRIGRAEGAAIAGGQRSVGIARTGGQRVGHHNTGRGRSHHAMAVGGGKGHRIGAHKAAIGHIGISAARPQTDGAVGGAGLGAGGQSGAVGHIDGARHHMLGGAAAAAGAVGQSIGHGHMGRHHVLLTARPIGGGKGDGVGAHESLGRRIGIMTVTVHIDGAVTRRTRGAGGQRGRIGRHKRPRIAGGQRTAGIAGAGRQGIGHDDMAGGRADHAVGIGGGKGHRIGAHEPRIGHIGVSAVGPHGHLTVGGNPAGRRGQARTVGHGHIAADHMLGQARLAGGAAGQGIADGHMGRHRADLTARPVGGGKGDGVGAHKALGRRIGIMAVAVHIDGAVTRRAAGAGAQSRRIAGAVGSHIAGCQRTRSIPGGRA